MEDHARRANHRVPVILRLLHFGGLAGVVVDRLARIFLAIADGRPAIIAAHLDLVQLVPTLRAVLHFPQPTLGIQRGALHVAIAIAPDFRPRAGHIHERVVLGDRTVAVHPHDLANQTVQILRLHAAGQDGTIAERDDQRAILGKHKAAAIMLGGIQRRHLAKDHLHIAHFGTHKMPTRDRRAVAAFARFGIAPVDPAIARIGDAQHAALVSCIGGRRTGDGRLAAIGGHDRQPACSLLADQEPALVQQRHAPRLVEARRNFGHGQRRFRGHGLGTGLAGKGRALFRHVGRRLRNRRGHGRRSDEGGKDQRTDHEKSPSRRLMQPRSKASNAARTARAVSHTAILGRPRKSFLPSGSPLLRKIPYSIEAWK